MTNEVAAAANGAVMVPREQYDAARILEIAKFAACEIARGKKIASGIGDEMGDILWRYTDDDTPWDGAARVLTKDEVLALKPGTVVWVQWKQWCDGEDDIEPKAFRKIAPAGRELYVTDAQGNEVVADADTMMIFLNSGDFDKLDNYGYVMRLWTKEPAWDQAKKTPWEES